MKKWVLLLTGAGILVLILLLTLYTVKYVHGAADFREAFSISDSTSGQSAQSGNSASHTAASESRSGYGTAAETSSTGTGQQRPSVGGNTGTSSEAAGSKTVNILLLGIDRNEDRDKTMGVYRTDTIVLVSIDPDTEKVSALSIPRDTYVYIPCINKKDKINHAYVWGGMNTKGINSTLETVNKFIKYSSVSYYFAIDMEAVPGVVNDLGGVEMDVDFDISGSKADVSKGRQILSGEQAYTYIRFRGTSNGDIGRIKRQREFVYALMNKFKQPEQWIDAVKAVLKYNKYIKTNLNMQQMVSFALLVSRAYKGGISFDMVPGHGEYIKGISYWIPDERNTDTILRKVLGCS